MLQIILTGDGSHTLFVPGLNEHFHSVHGAITESQIIYIENGLGCFRDKSHAVILEVGFGTGLNALMTLIRAKSAGITVTYYALENYPLEREIVRSLNYPFLLQDSYVGAPESFYALHDAPWDVMVDIAPHFKLKKIRAEVQGFMPDFRYDLVYYDAFAPEKQPEMWSENIFKVLIKGLADGGIITTYCVKGSVRRMWKNLGLEVQKLPGPPGKHEVMRGVKRLLAGDTI